MLSSLFATAMGISTDRDATTTMPPTKTKSAVTRDVGGDASNTSSISTRSPASVRSDSPTTDAPVVRNTFINLPVGRPLSMDDDFHEREIGSCPESGTRAPPGLIPWPRSDQPELQTGVPYSPVLSLEAALQPPITNSQELVPAWLPTQWPRTMSGEGLGDLLADFPSGGQTKLEQSSIDQQTASAEGLVKPMAWPRTMSGDDMFEVLAGAATMQQQLELLSVFGGSARFPPGQAVSPHWPVPEQVRPTAMMPPPPPAEHAPVVQPAHEVPPPPQAAPAYVLATLPVPCASPVSDAVVVLDLASVLPNQAGPKTDKIEFEQGSVGLPSVGSTGHGLGACKPCAFFHTKGCQSGVNCIFCHICELGEKRRRQKDRKHLLRGW